MHIQPYVNVYFKFGVTVTVSSLNFAMSFKVKHSHKPTQTP